MYNKGLKIINKKVKEKWQNSSENYIDITINLNKTTNDQTLTKSNYHFPENK